MATKDENVKRLQELAKQLGREPDISGSTADINQRVKEWEEELEQAGPDDDVTDPDNGAEGEPQQTDRSVAAGPSGWVHVKACATLHLDALASDCDRPLEMVVAGQTARIPAKYLTELKAAGLVTEL